MEVDRKDQKEAISGGLAKRKTLIDGYRKHKNHWQFNVSYDGKSGVQWLPIREVYEANATAVDEFVKEEGIRCKDSAEELHQLGLLKNALKRTAAMVSKPETREKPS